MWHQLIKVKSVRFAIVTFYAVDDIKIVEITENYNKKTVVSDYIKIFVIFFLLIDIYR